MAGTSMLGVPLRVLVCMSRAEGPLQRGLLLCDGGVRAGAREGDHTPVAGTPRPAHGRKAQSTASVPLGCGWDSGQG